MADQKLLLITDHKQVTYHSVTVETHNFNIKKQPLSCGLIA